MDGWNVLLALKLLNQDACRAIVHASTVVSHARSDHVTANTSSASKIKKNSHAFDVNAHILALEHGRLRHTRLLSLCYRVQFFRGGEGSN